MQIVYTNAEQYILRFDPGEDVITELRNFCSTHNICVATFTGIGAAQEAVLAYYNLDTKEYEEHPISERVEITSMTGHISWVDGGAHVHAHGVLGTQNLEARTGHIQKLVVSGTCEVVLATFSGSITRKHDPETGLSLLAPNSA